MPPPPPRDEPSDSQRMPLMAVALARSVDFKIPLWAIMVLAGSGLLAVSRMYMQVEQLVVTLASTNDTLRAVNSQLGEMSKAQALAASEITALRDRMTRIEQDHSRLVLARHEKP
jgi:hypothetical protein